MWIIYALGSALFAGMTAILAKIGIKNTDSNLSTAIRTVVVLLFSWIIVFIVGSQHTITTISTYTLIFLILSGCATGASWLCYFKALQLGDVNKITPIDKSSAILTIILAFLFLGETPTPLMCLGVVVFASGTYFMIQRKKSEKYDGKGKMWLFYAVLSAVFASLTSILGKIGIQGVESNLGTAIRTIVVLIMAWVIVFIQKKHVMIKNIDMKSWVFIILSGIATGFSWLCYYHALQTGRASMVVPIDQLSIVVSIAFSRIFLGERLSRKAFIGLMLVILGTMLLLF
ncbi:transporter family protein [Clostridium acidisoli DSM 12555]|uniref:Transporter family protein n=1 Tax=Clostridium acidisoli DSM 12555 TaxID=1121291 RepID=A0A1W1XPZ6_9CLOT|nr:EamA family transporter [Clostridium acidisoli]SMC25966.1 transporter family protein [Clostridium acidisoli DSM 12555]